MSFKLHLCAIMIAIVTGTAMCSDLFAAPLVSKRQREFIKGDQAITRLGVHADNVAKRYQLQNGEQLKQALHRDRTLRLSIKKIEDPMALDNQADAEDAELLFADEVPESALSAGGADLPTNPTATNIPDTQTFLLHSRVGARGTVWLNFKGETSTSSYWNDGNTVTAGPYSLDSNNDFSSTELGNIKNMWLQVAEDYAAFDVDVTTEKPANPELTHYIEVVVTMTDAWYPDAGGVCYVSSFGWSTSPGKMCWVFPNALLKNTKYIAEAITHEAGHSFGLYHWSQYDSSGKLLDSYYPGNATWGPIMGASYSSTVSTWCKGDYSNSGTSKGYGNLQDDISVIKNKIGGNGITDEAGSDKNSAAIMNGTANGTSLVLNQQGIISSQTDLDVFKMFTTGGDMLITVKPAAVQPNLDFQVRVLNDSYTALYTANPTMIGPATVTLPSLSAGTYYVEISPMGYGDPLAGTGYPAYSSNGRYYISGTFAGAAGSAPSPTPTPTPVPTASPTPTPGMGCTRSGWNSTNCSGTIRKVTRVSIL